LPEAVVTRASELLDIFSRERLRGQDVETAAVSETPQFNGRKASTRNGSMSLFESEPHPVVEALKKLDVDNLTPLEAMVKLQELRKQALNN
jgi:DNA mismatch repair protein MutS